MEREPELKTNEQALNDDGWRVDESNVSQAITDDYENDVKLPAPKDFTQITTTVRARKEGFRSIWSSYSYDERDKPETVASLREAAFEQLCMAAEKAVRSAPGVLRVASLTAEQMSKYVESVRPGTGALVIDSHNATPEDAVRVLNEALEAEPEVMNLIFAYHPVTSTTLRDHPTIQIGGTPEQHTLSALGLINGIFGVDERGWGFIGAARDAATGRLIGFALVPPGAKAEHFALPLPKQDEQAAQQDAQEGG